MHVEYQEVPFTQKVKRVELVFLIFKNEHFVKIQINNEL